MTTTDATPIQTEGGFGIIRKSVRLDSIADNPWQPRRAMDPVALAALADSIDQLGVISTPLGRFMDDGIVQLAYGHRRVEAVRLLHQQERWEAEMDVDVAVLSDEQMAMAALAENEVREKLTPIEVARAHKKIIDDGLLTLTELATAVGADKSTISNHLRVLDLPAFVLAHVDSGEMGISVAREFLALQSDDHCHNEDMLAVIKGAIGYQSEYHYTTPPDWTRTHIRLLISRRVQLHPDRHYRPLGPQTPISQGEGSKDASFDVAAFVADVGRSRTHTIPADGGEEKYDTSRLWTCAASEWSRWQSAATRARNAASASSGLDGEFSRENSPREKLLSGVRPSSKSEESSDLDAAATTYRIIEASPEPEEPRPLVDREKVEAYRKRQDWLEARTVVEGTKQVKRLAVSAQRTLLSALLAATPWLEMWHPLGAYDEEFSQESPLTANVRQSLGVEGEYMWGRIALPDIDVDSILERQVPGLAASLMAYHLRRTGKLGE